MTVPVRAKRPLLDAFATVPFDPVSPGQAERTVQSDGETRVDGRPELLAQARRAEQLGSPFLATVLRAVARNLDAAPRLSALVNAWPGDPAASAMALRLAAGLHASARSGRLTALTQLYTTRAGDFDATIAFALAEEEADLLAWMSHPTQTNEVGRSATFMATLMQLASRHAHPFELLELGASAGLNLNLGRYAYDLGGTTCGEAGSILTIKPEWRGPAPAAQPVTIRSAQGVDIDPIDTSDASAQSRLKAYVWPDRPDRMARLECALDIAQSHRPAIQRGLAGAWLDSRLGSPQDDGVCRVVIHSMVMQYLAPDERRQILASTWRAGARATRARPLALIGLEWASDRSEVQLRLTEWCGSEGGAGHCRTLAVCHPYGQWIDWRA